LKKLDVILYEYEMRCFKNLAHTGTCWSNCNIYRAYSSKR